MMKLCKGSFVKLWRYFVCIYFYIIKIFFFGLFREKIERDTRLELKESIYEAKEDNYVFNFVNK